MVAVAMAVLDLLLGLEWQIAIVSAVGAGALVHALLTRRPDARAEYEQALADWKTELEAWLEADAEAGIAFLAHMDAACQHMDDAHDARTASPLDVRAQRRDESANEYWTTALVTWSFRATEVAKKLRRTAARERLDAGTSTVILARVSPAASPGAMTRFLSQILGYDIETAHDIVERAEHIEPQEIVSDVSERDAIELKKIIEGLNGKARIINGRSDLHLSYRREPVPERVRHEVWRRDHGACVQCGSRERLEFDHMIPLSKGGSNTARNLQLLCESCNRRKGATI